MRRPVLRIVAEKSVIARVLVAIALAITLPLATGCANDQRVIAQAGEFHGELSKAVVTDPELSSYIQQLGDRILQIAEKRHSQGYRPKNKGDEDNAWMFSRAMQFHFVNSKTLNAFTTGGEHMYVYTGLLMQCETEDELAAVLCHEYAHVFARHVHQGMSRQYWTYGAAAAGAVAGAALGANEGSEDAMKYGALGAGAGLVAGQFIGMGFTREDEAEADKLGFRIYTRAGWDPRKFGDFFKRMVAMGYDTTPELASDHPTLRSRVQDAERRASELSKDANQYRRPAVAQGREFDQLKQRATQLAKNMPDDKSMEDAQTLLASFSSCVAPVAQPEQVRARQRIVQEQEQRQPQTRR
jgi:beta-barrel assembly-enhancing protease